MRSTPAMYGARGALAAAASAGYQACAIRRRGRPGASLSSRAGSSIRNVTVPTGCGPPGAGNEGTGITTGRLAATAAPTTAAATRRTAETLPRGRGSAPLRRTITTPRAARA